MKSYILGMLTTLALVAIPFSVWIVPSPDAQGQSYAVVRGAGEAGMVEEQLNWKVKNKKRNLTVQRVVIRVPRSYGQLVNIAGSTDQVLWFVDDSSNLRNVVIGQKLVKIEFEGTRG